MSTEIRKALIEERRRRYLESLIKEAVTNVLVEQEQEAMTAPPVPAPTAPAPSQPPAPPAGNDLEQTQPSSADQTFTVDDMIERLNVIRGGRSFTDPEVYGRLVTYFKTLDDASRQSLEKFLIELGKIVIDVGQEKPADPNGNQEAPAAQPPAPEASPTPPAPIAPVGQ